MMARHIRKEPFPKWVSRMGGELLAPTNPYETFRFKAGDATHVVYQKKTGRTAFSSPECQDIWHSYERGEDRPFHKSTRHWLKGDPVRRALVERDGNECFYCGVSFDALWLPTIEHLVARIHKGPDHISNKFLACETCNTEAGHLSAPEKIRLREQKRQQNPNGKDGK